VWAVGQSLLSCHGIEQVAYAHSLSASLDLSL
jgi:hypothetical protein